MLKIASIDPEIFHFENLKDDVIKINVELFLRGILTNGLIILDNLDILQQGIIKNIHEAIQKSSIQRISILYVEIFKNPRKKIVKLEIEKQMISADEEVVEILFKLYSKYEIDGLLVTENTRTKLASLGIDLSKTILPREYYKSNFEEKRYEYLFKLPPIDQIEDQKSVNNIFKKFLLYTRNIYFYDKQIGNGKNLNDFYRGISFILNLWKEYGFFSNEQDAKVEIVTSVKTKEFSSTTLSHEDNKRAFNSIKNKLLKKLKENYPWEVTLRLKNPDNVFHSRHLKTDHALILFERGFDFIKGNKSFKRNIIKIDDSSKGHIEELDRLDDLQYDLNDE